MDLIVNPKDQKNYNKGFKLDQNLLMTQNSEDFSASPRTMHPHLGK